MRITMTLFTIGKISIESVYYGSVVQPEETRYYLRGGDEKVLIATTTRKYGSFIPYGLRNLIVDKPKIHTSISVAIDPSLVGKALENLVEFEMALPKTWPMMDAALRTELVDGVSDVAKTLIDYTSQYALKQNREKDAA